MTLALLVGGAVIAAVVLVTRRPDEPVPPRHTDWQTTTVSALCDAEDLLDRLENQGYAEREVVVLENSCIAVRWR